MVRRVGSKLPVVVVTANSTNVTGNPGIRVMALADIHARGVFALLCAGGLIHPLRGDTLMVGQAAPSSAQTSQQAASAKRLMDMFAALTKTCKVPLGMQFSLEGALDKAVCSRVEELNVALLALQLPQNVKGLSPYVLSVLRSSRAAVLLYQEGLPSTRL
mmetsp:Transcript_35165/g.78283  ORF Transcript_35165/g.78283 Transcript_35165/m.78283 type:complete len:160 (+) Transcript_35165:3-482(+)